MRLIIQKVTQASVDVGGNTVGQIGKGLLVYVGISKNDTPDTIRAGVQKLLDMRIFTDEKEEKHFHKSIQDEQGELLLISQFTLYGSLERGRRPSFDMAMSPDGAKVLYELFVEEVQKQHRAPVATGVFQAHMKVSSTNDGPVTLFYEL